MAAARRPLIFLSGEIWTFHSEGAVKKADRKKLEAKGYKVYDDAADWLGLTDAERRMVDLRVAVARRVQARRLEAGLTQAALADRMKSSQSRVAKIEAAAPGVSLDLMFQGLFAAGGSVAEVARVLPSDAAAGKRRRYHLPPPADAEHISGELIELGREEDKAGRSS
jgi:transcriptional regulator with XRE-family HTH domain